MNGRKTLSLLVALLGILAGRAQGDSSSTAPSTSTSAPTASSNSLGTVRPVYGWGGVMRLGRWTPLFVNVADRQTQSIELQIHAAQAVGGALRISQSAVAQPQPTLFASLFPLDTDLSHAIAIARDEKTEKTLAWQLLLNPTSFTPAGNVPVRVLAPDDILVGLSGNIAEAALVQTQLQRSGVNSGMLDLFKLPINWIGYDDISTLILVGGDLRELDAGQQRALVDWISAGGNLLLIPGSQAMPEGNLIEMSLPCRVGVNKAFEAKGLLAATRPTSLNGRELETRTGSSDYEALGSAAAKAGWVGYSRTLGLGRIAVIPVNVSALQFSSDEQARQAWTKILLPLFAVPAPRIVTAHEVSLEQEDIIPVGATRADSVGRGPRETFAVRLALGGMNMAGRLPHSDWPQVLLVLVGVCLLLGPVDSVLMLRMGRSPWHWLSVLGWVGIVVCAGGWAVMRVGAAPLRVAQLRIVDQADHKLVAATDLLGVESDRPRKLPMNLNEDEWWEPANQAELYFSKDRFVDMDFRQDHHGCRPDVLSLQAYEPQSMIGQTMVSGPAPLEASLTLGKDMSGMPRLVGTLINHSSADMVDVQVATSAGNFLAPGVSAGGSVRVDEPLSASPIVFRALPPDVLDVSSDRQDRINALVAGGRACVYCRMNGAAPLGLMDSAGDQWHAQILRAVVDLTRE